jgi:single-strand DNA-binding protein
MYNINAVMLSGVLANDVELRYTQSGKPVCSFAVKYSRAGSKSVAYIDCVAWETLAEVVAQMHKDEQIAVTGQLATRSYEKDGSKHKVTEVVVGQILNGTGEEVDDDIPV